MGRYDNYQNTRNIKKAQKKFDKLQSKRKPDAYKIEIARQELESAKLFESCQRFQLKGFGGMYEILFSDDNKVIWFVNKLIRYDNLSHYTLTANDGVIAHTETKSSGSISRAIVGGAIAGGVGAVVGAVSAGAKSNTTYSQRTDGFLFSIYTKDGKGYEIKLMGDGLLQNKVPKEGLLFGERLRMIIEEQET